MTTMTTFKDAPTKTIEVGGTRVVYRELGPGHWRAGDLSAPPRRRPRQLGPPRGGRHRREATRDHVRQPRGRRVRRQDTENHRGDGARRGRIHPRPRLRSGRPVRLLDGRHDRSGDRAGGAASRAQDDPRRHRPRGGRGHRQGGPSHLPRHGARTARPPGPQGVSLLHQDSERARSREGVPGATRGTYRRPRHGHLGALLPRPAEGHPPLGSAGSREPRPHPPAGARHERRERQDGAEREHHRPRSTTPEQPARGVSGRRARRGVPVPRGLRQARSRVPMKAFVVEHYGPDGLRAAEVPEPEIGDGDVLIKVSAAGINPLDKMVRDGEFKRLLKYKTPFVLGHDVAGVVTRVGSAVRDFQVGDEVYARPRDLRIGTFAEYIAIDQDDVAPKPASLTLHETAAVPLVSLAAWQALVDRAHVKPGQKVLVHAGSGGLGSTAIQLAKHLGATVATTARGENAELVRSFGADVVGDYTQDDFAEGLSCYDVVMDTRRGGNLEGAPTILKPV